MERSEPDDGAWDEPLGRDSWMWGTPGEPEYPAAPLPTHERRWRHPSELGHAEWVQSEKAVGLGRGLVITSGAIGCILGLAVVWLMVPGAGTAPTADPSVARSDVALPTTAAFALSSTTAMPVSTLSTAPRATLPTATPPAPSDPIVVASTAPVAPPVETAAPVQSQAPVSTTATLQLPAEDLPTNTVWLKSRAEGASAAVAVLLGDSPYMITTASAVGASETVRVMMLSGGVTEAPVVNVDATFAYLQPDDSLLTFGFAAAAAATPGESLTVLADDEIVFTFGDDTLASTDPASIAEGTPVVNESGALVGLCTGSRGVVELVPIAAALPDRPTATPDTAATGDSLPQPSTTIAVVTTTPAPSSSAPTSTTSAPSSSTTTTSSTSTTVVTTTTVAAAKKAPWVGIRLGGSESSPALGIVSVTPGSPAAAAGLVVGDEVVAVDGTPVKTVDDVSARVGVHSVGETVVFTVSAAATDGATRTRRDVAIVLGERSL